jgi:hypothetical protein
MGKNEKTGGQGYYKRDEYNVEFQELNKWNKNEHQEQ